ncbi:hypothetical protein CEXT_329691 [Caerostris extrusa]|uniref:Uncharacterized protein n=1 Tax=Caerostris extrusa TaxID=172846 RepID=A0AAV4T5D8_CAEEX|nr:hypothetical protein CEXT_329691 [Caerostris extrusa]
MCGMLRLHVTLGLRMMQDMFGLYLDGMLGMQVTYGMSGFQVLTQHRFHSVSKYSVSIQYSVSTPQSHHYISAICRIAYLGLQVMQEMLDCT